MQKYKVEITANNYLCIRQIFNVRTKAQKYILEKYRAYSNDKRFYIRFTHYSNWGKYKKPCNDMCLDSMNVQTKDINICVELSPV
jgi:hypothetical protein